MNSVWILLIAATLTLSACSGSHSSSGSPNGAPLSGNWQFTVASPTDQSFLGGLQGGFLLQNNGAVTGAAVYSILSPPAQTGGNATVCNSGSAPITGTLSGQNVTLTAVAGAQTFTFTGMLSSDVSTMTGTYASTAPAASSTASGTPCGTAQTGLQWSAISVPPLSGVIQGSFHSTGGAAGLENQDFAFSGSLMQGQNIGASNATITGTLNFVNQTTNLTDYPCFGIAQVNGQISGNTVILQIIGTNGSTFGQIGGTTGSGVSTVTFDSTPSGYVLHSIVSPAYAVNTSSCPGAGLNNAGDFGSMCLTMGNSSACQQPITLSPALLTFPPQLLGSASTTQTITLTNSDPAGSTLGGLNLTWLVNNGIFDNGAPSDFNGLPNFAEQDNCASSLGASFSLAAGQSCSINITFTPQESCPWLPFGNPPSIAGAAPAHCPLPLTAVLTVNSPVSADSNTAFAVPITGYGASVIQPSTPELDFGAEAVSESSPAQTLSFTNFGANPVQILASAPGENPTKGQLTLPYPLQQSSAVSGLQVVSNGLSSIGNIGVARSGATITYNCDSDSGTLQPNFQISADSCVGIFLLPQATCGLTIKYVPQPNTNLTTGLDYFLELNTNQCSLLDGVTLDCEIDSGRFPVELKANPPSTLRMSPSAGLDFGGVTVGQGSAPLMITLLNDATVASPATVNFVGKVVVQGNYVESDNCPFSLAPGSSCVLTLTFVPGAVGFDPGTVTINYSPELNHSPQIIYLRGTGR
ncbi:MAG: choice-of-anchor D domain-containing protein [Candidatus Sulfotelmatobacter sp.]